MLSMFSFLVLSDLPIVFPCGPLQQPPLCCCRTSWFTNWAPATPDHTVEFCACWGGKNKKKTSREPTHMYNNKSCQQSRTTLLLSNYHSARHSDRRKAEHFDMRGKKAVELLRHFHLLSCHQFLPPWRKACCTLHFFTMLSHLSLFLSLCSFRLPVRLGLRLHSCGCLFTLQWFEWRGGGGG